MELTMIAPKKVYFAGDLPPSPVEAPVAQEVRREKVDLVCGMCAKVYLHEQWGGTCSYECYEAQNPEVDIECMVCKKVYGHPNGWPRGYCSRGCCTSVMYALEEEQDESFTCIACTGFVPEPSGWKDLCHRGCFYDMCNLLDAYESGRVVIPDPRVVDYFTRNPDGGGHGFGEPVRTIMYIRCVVFGKRPRGKRARKARSDRIRAFNRILHMDE